MNDLKQLDTIFCKLDGLGIERKFHFPPYKGQKRQKTIVLEVPRFAREVPTLRFGTMRAARVPEEKGV